MNNTVAIKKENTGGAQVYRKTPEEKLALKEAKKEHKAWLAKQAKETNKDGK